MKTYTQALAGLSSRFPSPQAGLQKLKRRWRWRWAHKRAFYWLRWHVTCYMHRCYTCHRIVGKRGTWVIGYHRGFQHDLVNRFYCERHDHNHERAQ